MTLNTDANLVQPDDFYQALIDAHAGDRRTERALNRALYFCWQSNWHLSTLQHAIAAHAQRSTRRLVFFK